jgi:cAMP-dependent protein kinase regulator
LQEVKEEILEIEPEMKLPKVPLFSDFNEDEFLAIVQKVRAIHLDAGAYLFREGDGGDSIFFISEGVVEVTGLTKDGMEVSFAKLCEGDVFGEFGFFSNAKRRTGVRAYGAAILLELTKADLEDIIANHKRVGDVLINFYKERVVDRLMALSTVFQPLGPDDRKEVLKRLNIVSFAKGGFITREGEPGDTMYLIKEGRVSVWVKDKNNNEKTLTELEEGDFFGEIALATNKPRVASVTALTDVKLVEFSRLTIKEMITKCPSIKTILERVIRERVSGLVSAREQRGTMI